MLIKKKEENKKLNDLMRKINFDYINPPFNDISKIFLKQFNIIKEYIKNKEKEKENYINDSNEIQNDKNSKNNKLNKINNNENKNGISNYYTNSFKNINTIRKIENKSDKMISNYYSNYFNNNKDILNEGNKNEISYKNKDSFNKNKPIKIKNNINNLLKYSDDKESNLSSGKNFKNEEPLFNQLKNPNKERANSVKNRCKNTNNINSKNRKYKCLKKKVNLQS